MSSLIERSVLGAIILSGDCFYRVVDRIKADDFEERDYREVWLACERLARAGKPIDETTIVAELGENCKTPVTLVFELAGGLPDVANVEYYADSLRSKSVGRQLRELSAWLANSGMAPDDLLADLQAKILTISERTGGDHTEQIALPLGRAVNHLQEIANHGHPDLTSGLLDLDSMIAGFEPCDLIIIAGQPGTGKTALVVNILAHLCGVKRKRAMFFSLEMSSEQIGLRLVAREEKVKFGSLRRPHKDDPFFWQHVATAQDRISEWPLVIDDSSNLTVLEMLARCRLEKMARGLDIVAVDFIQLANGRGDNRAQIIGGIARDLKNLAKTLGVPVLALSQLTLEQAKAKRQPTMFDLKESGDIGAAADVVILLHEVEAVGVTKTIQAIVGKQRNGPTGDKPRLLFFPEILRFENFAKEES